MIGPLLPGPAPTSRCSTGRSSTAATTRPGSPSARSSTREAASSSSPRRCCSGSARTGPRCGGSARWSSSTATSGAHATASTGRVTSLDSNYPVTDGERFPQLVTIGALSDEWLPAAYAPVSYSGFSAGWDQESSTLIVRGGKLTTSGATYALTSIDPTPLYTPDFLPRARRRRSRRRRRALPRAAGRLQPPDHRARRTADAGPGPPVRQGAGAAELLPRQLHVLPRRQPGARDQPHGAVRLRRAVRLLRAVQRDVRRHGPGRRPARTRRGRLHSRRAGRAASGSCGASTTTPGPRSTSAGTGCTSSRRRAGAPRAPSRTPACPSSRRTRTTPTRRRPPPPR